VKKPNFTPHFSGWVHRLHCPSSLGDLGRPGLPRLAADPGDSGEQPAVVRRKDSGLAVGPLRGEFREKARFRNVYHSVWPGVDVMITIFCDFLQFSAKKLAVFSKTNVMIKILHNLALFWVKNANFFAEIFGENILKIITSVPDEFVKKSPEMLPNPFLSKLVHNFYHGKTYSKNLGYFCNFKKLLKMNTNPMSENSPILVTLFPSLSKV
jgi:hypothetical protein